MCLAQGPQHSYAGEAQTRGPSFWSQALYYWATVLPNAQLHKLARHWFFACSMFRYYTFQIAYNKGADQSAQMCVLVCAFVVCLQQNLRHRWESAVPNADMVKDLGQFPFQSAQILTACG